MIYGSKEDGGAVITLTPEEHERFKNGEPVVRRSGYSKGVFTITLKMEQPKDLVERYPLPMYAFDDIKGHKPADLSEIIQKVDLGCYLRDADLVAEIRGLHGDYPANRIQQLLELHRRDMPVNHERQLHVIDDFRKEVAKASKPDSDREAVRKFCDGAVLGEPTKV